MCYNIKMKSKILEKAVKIFIILVTMFGFVFLMNYIFNSSIDLILSDYIRIVNNYLNNIYDFKYLFSFEFITRVPITYLMRIVNVVFFKYSVFFDKIVGILFLSFFNLLICDYVSKQINNFIIKFITIISISLISFSLLQWEMILNGTGYPHYMTIFLIIIIYLNYEKYNCRGEQKYSCRGEQKYGCRGEHCEPLGTLIPLIVLILSTSLIFAGSYQVAYLFTIFFYCILQSLYIDNKIIKIVNDKQKIKKNVLLMSICILCILLYLISSNTGEVVNPVGFNEISLIELLVNDIKFPIKFILKSLSSSIIGVETLDLYKMAFFNNTDKFIYVIGFLYIIVILSAIAFYFKYKLKYIFLELMFITGVINYGLIFLARFRFLNVNYGMSSRYGIQYMFLSISIVSIIFITIDKILYEKNIKLKNIALTVVLLVSVIFINLGHIITTKNELDKMEARKMYYINAKNVALNIENYSDEDLKNVFEYRRSAESIKMAFKILKDKKYNIYK